MMVQRYFRQIMAAITLTILAAGCSQLNVGTIAYPTLNPAPTELFPAFSTGTAIVSRKFTEAAQMATSLAALPTGTPSPTLGPTSTLCPVGDLAGEVRTNGATGHITFSVDVTNVGNSTCTLPAPPDIQLVNRQGIPLDLDMQSFCSTCAPAEAIGATPSPSALALTQTAEPVVHQPVNLGAHQVVNFSLIWANWCGAFPPGGVSVRLHLEPGIQLDLPSDAPAGGRCDAPGERS
ncbi:MAG: DUF4232 domain-containing protein, partial [Anaerolineaceae bacterium]|nr:DUF4232 domain-containing protein [Anaerolineaceae bacterium]